MFQTTTRSSAATSFKVTAAFIKAIDEAFSRWASDDYGDRHATTLIGEDLLMGEKTYLVDLRDVFAKFGKYEDVFYFYPHGLDGFIESCVLGTQRVLSEPEREIMIYRDVRDAMDHWKTRLEEAAFMQSFPVNENLTVEDFEVREAVRIGGMIDNAIVDKMQLLRDVHGDYAIDGSDLQWTRSHGLCIRLRY